MDHSVKLGSNVNSSGQGASLTVRDEKYSKLDSTQSRPPPISPPPPSSFIGSPEKSDSSDDEQNRVGTGDLSPQQKSQSQPHLSGSTSSSSTSASQSQKRPMNAFLIFCKRHRSVVKKKYPHLENRSITKILGEWWAALDQDQKHKYTELARQYKEAFMKANPHFKWYKTDIRAPMQPPSPTPPVPPSPSPLIDHRKISGDQLKSNQPLQQKTPSQTTPKPPKKRYLENGEFKESAVTNVTVSNVVEANLTAIITTSTSALTTRPAMTKTVSSKALQQVGPLMLDEETANRVIENALGGLTSSSSSSSSLPFSSKIREKDSTHSLGSHLNSVIKSRLSDDSKNTSSKSAGREQDSKSDSPPPTVRTAAIAKDSEANTMQSTTNTIKHNSPQSSSTQPAMSSSSEEKPLNLSASKVLHTSNQQIINHFIDKLLSDGAEGNPMPAEMLPQSETNSCNSAPPSGNPSPSKQNRKERTCKGKRYLELINEGKLMKRSKINSTTGSTSQSDDAPGSSKTGSTMSKWVSGGFDLEEHIANLPQLGDTHLINALNHSKSIKSPQNKPGEDTNSSGTRNGSISRTNEDGDNSVANNGSNSNNETSTSDKLNENGLKLCEDTQENNEMDDEQFKSASVKQLSRRPGIDVIETRNCVNNIAKKSDVNDNNEIIEHPQGIESCDGLVALAEVALQQANRSISSQSSS